MIDCSTYYAEFFAYCFRFYLVHWTIIAGVLLRHNVITRSDLTFPGSNLRMRLSLPLKAEYWRGYPDTPRGRTKMDQSRLQQAVCTGLVCALHIHALKIWSVFIQEYVIWKTIILSGARNRAKYFLTPSGPPPYPNGSAWWQTCDRPHMTAS